ncbi:MAG: ribonuclease HII [Acidobacteriales bacterium]|nr:ribonuclease HII [Terriglobales bacterium]
MPRKTKKIVLGKDGKPLSKSAVKLRMIKRLKCSIKFEKAAWASGATLVAGVDEVGRGSLFGPVVAAAVILDPSYRIKGLRDSKLLDAERRKTLASRIREHAIAIGIAAVDACDIDSLNIYHASRLAMLRAVEQLAPAPDHLLIDAMQIEHSCAQTKIFYGDAQSISIAAASIVAKVFRDAMFAEWEEKYPGYDLGSNKGYRSPKHIAALREPGATELHRRSFAPAWSKSAVASEDFARGLAVLEEEGVEMTPVQRAQMRARGWYAGAQG